MHSQMTVREKLDVLYDLALTNSDFQDGIGIEEATALVSQVLRNHQQLIPYNELEMSVQKVFSKDRLNGLIAAYWTNLSTSEIQSESKAKCSLSDFLNGKGSLQVDLTSEVRETLNNLTNFSGNKIIDFNLQTSLFSHISNFFEKNEIGLRLMGQSLKFGQIKQLYRLCLVVQVGNGERVVYEVYYNLSNGLVQNADNKEGES